MSLQAAERALVEAQEQARDAWQLVVAAQAVLDDDPSDENAEALHQAKTTAEKRDFILGARQKAVAREREAAEFEARQEAKAQLAEQLDEIHSERARLHDVVGMFLDLYRQLSNQVDFASDLVAQDMVRLRAARETAERAGMEVDVQPLDLEVIRIAVTLRLAERFPAADTPSDAMPPGGPLRRAIAKLAGAGNYSQVATHAAEVLAELAAELGSAPADWLALAPRRSAPGTTAETLKPAAQRLLERYCSEPEFP